MNTLAAAWMLGTFVMVAPFAVDAQVEEPVCGDVNDSGTVNTSDALQVLRKGVGQPVTLNCSAYDERFSTCEDDLDACTGGTRCGDGIVNSVGEHCDESDLGGADCKSLGFGAGTLACTAGCKFDASACGPCPEGSHLYAGKCWLLGSNPLEGNGSCNSACASIGLTCDEAALNQIASTNDACRIAVDEADPDAAPHPISSLSPLSIGACGNATDYAIGCTNFTESDFEQENGALRYAYEGSGVLCGADYDGGPCGTPARRVCACSAGN